MGWEVFGLNDEQSLGISLQMKCPCSLSSRTTAPPFSPFTDTGTIKRAFP